MGNVIMTLPRFIEIDGRCYRWRELVALRRARTTAQQELPPGIWVVCWKQAIT
jgi:hypothetical protein